MPADDPWTDVDLVPADRWPEPARRAKRTVAVRLYELAVSLPIIGFIACPSIQNTN